MLFGWYLICMVNGGNIGMASSLLNQKLITNGKLNSMKTTFVVLFVLCAASAFGQVASSVSSQPQIQAVPEHPQHADIHSMATEQSLVGGGNITYAQGERPVWEFGEIRHEPALGDVARAYRKEKSTGKKAEIIYEKQGS